MPIEISVLYSPDNVEISQFSYTFPEEGGTLGRSNNNFWILQDPNKYMSSVHAKIECISGTYYLTDMSTNGTFINGASEPVGNSNQVALMDGDHFTISDYEFVTNIKQDLADNNPFSIPPNDDPFSDFDINGQQPVIEQDFLSPSTQNNDPFASGINSFAVTENNHSAESIDPMAILNRKPNNSDSPFGEADKFDAPTQPLGFPESTGLPNDNAYENQPVVTDSIDWPIAKPEVGTIPDDWDDWDSDPLAPSDDLPTSPVLPTSPPIYPSVDPEPFAHGQSNQITPKLATEIIAAESTDIIPEDFFGADPFDDLMGHNITPSIQHEGPFNDQALKKDGVNPSPFEQTNSLPDKESSTPLSQEHTSSFYGSFDIENNFDAVNNNESSMEKSDEDDLDSNLDFQIPLGPTAILPSSLEVNHSTIELDALITDNKQLQQTVAELTAQLQTSQLQVKQLQASQQPSTTSSIPMNTPNNALENSVIEAMGLSKWNLQPNKVAEINQIVGLLMRETMEGMMRVLKFRKKIKEEFRINVTTIQSVENNPLKFSANIDDAMENMFIKDNNAYKSPVDAVKEGFESIAEHQVAVVAGMQAAFKGMIERFDPAHLESRFEKYNNSSFLSLGKKTKRWSDYKAYHKDLSENLDDSFQHLFGYDFVQAYEEQMQHLISVRIKENQ